MGLSLGIEITAEVEEGSWSKVLLFSSEGSGLRETDLSNKRRAGSDDDDED